MENLRIFSRWLRRFSNKDALPLVATAWDNGSNTLICAFGPTQSRALVELKRLHYKSGSTENVLDNIASWDSPCPLPSLTHDSILDLHYFPDTSTSCLIMAGGDIILVKETSLLNEQAIEIVGSIDAGIATAAWSPDEELLAIVTQADTILLMSRDVENIANITLSAEDVNVSTHVSVGWGKKETQFKGKRARALQDPTVPETIDQGVLSPNDDQSIAISWRGDGAYFAVNKIEASQRRMIRVYSREGLLDAVSEPVDGLEGALSWRPSGNLITGIRRLNDKAEVVFFERNGLRRGEFDLRLSQTDLDALIEPLKLSWNIDSSVIAVIYPQKVQFWNMSNYHYYLKQENMFPEACPHTIFCHWNPERALTTALFNTSTLQVLDFVSTRATGSIIPPNDFGMVATIDGLSLKLTPLRKAMIPPPMSLQTLALECQPVDVALSVSGNRIAILYQDSVIVYDLDVTQQPMSKPTIMEKFDLKKEHVPRQIVFTTDDQFHTLIDIWDKTGSYLWTLSSEALSDQDPIPIEENVTTLSTSISHIDLFLQSQDGSLFSAAAAQTKLICKFPSPSIDTQIVIFNEKTLVFGLSSTNKLFANERILIRNCTSFMVTNTYLIVITSQHFLKFVPLADVEDLEVPADDVQNDECCRRIERGAKIVTIMPTTALVLAAIRQHIDNGEYDAAFMICRNQRADMNILHDHDPTRFMSSIEQIIQQIKQIDFLDLMFAQFRNEDVSRTMYKGLKSSRQVSSREISCPAEIETKVNRVCDAFIRVLERSQYKYSHLQNVITLHCSKTPPDLETALELINELHSSNSELIDRAVEHICFLADINQLYNTSLGLYNLELGLMIAQQSQRDPREYLPYLQSLQDLKPGYRKFQIDDQLGRRKKALGHLNDLQAFEEVYKYVKDHDLYTEALELYRYDTARHSEIMKAYATYLSANNQNKEAALAYESLDDHTKAWPCYRAANMWQEALSSVTIAAVSPEELQSIAGSLADGLTESKDYTAAATITLDYLSDISTAAKLFCKGCYFAEALRLIALHKQPDLVAEVIDPALSERSADMTEFLADMREQLLAQVPRLRDLRAKKLEDPAAFYDGMNDGDTNIPDNISLAPTDTTSGRTLMTRYTNQTGTVNTQATRKTSKNKRREERKRARGKKGTVYEEEYLVNSFERLVERINSMQDEIQRLVEGLIRRNMRVRAEAVSNAVGDVVEKCQEAIKEIYATPVTLHEERGGKFEEELKPVGGNATLWNSVREVEKKREAPKVISFTKSTLL